MKVSRSVLFAAILFAGILSSCAKDVSFEQETTRMEEIGLTKSKDSSVETKGKVKPFSKNMLGPLARAMDFNGEYHLEPIIKTNSAPGEMPAMYVMNFEEGGWMIVAGHIREENQVLAYSKVGQFNIDEIENPNVKFWFEMTRAQMDSFEIESPLETSMLASPHSIDPEQDFLWIRVPIESTITRTSEYSTGHLLTTKWGQDSPWNAMTLSTYSNAFRRTGCVAVSCAQILYYLKMSSGFNIGLYDVSGEYLHHRRNHEDYYTIANIQRTNFDQNSTKWADMRKTIRSGGNTMYVAELMFDIAEHVGMEFHIDRSEAFISPSLFNFYAIACDEETYDFNLVKASLDNSLPVEISCYNDNSHTKGHSWVIDGYKTERYHISGRYQWLLVPVDSIIDYDFVEVLTTEDMPRIHPGIQDGDTVNGNADVYARHLLMNWGWDGDYDEGVYSITPSWPYQLPDNTEMEFLSSDPMIIFNFRQ